MATGNVNKRTVDALKPGAAIAFLWDDDDKGFGVKVTPAGAMTYLYQYRMGGRESPTRRWTIGRHGSPWTPAQARGEAKRLAMLVAQGIDPAEADQKRRRDAVDLKFKPYSLRFHAACEGAGWAGLVERTLRLHVWPVLADKALPAITRPDVVAIFDRLPTEQKALRRNTFAVLRRLFRWAVSRGDIAQSPLDGMDTPEPVKARDRVLSDDELRRVWSGAGHCYHVFANVVRLLIVTGQRRDEVTGMRWEEVNRATGLWTLPGERTKNSEGHSITLPALAIEVLDGIAKGDKWPKVGRVFATRTGAAFTAHNRGKQQLDDTIGKDGHGAMQPWRLHDLRRTLATGFQRLGIRFEVTEAVLNHLSGSRAGVAGVYQRHHWTDEKRAALRAWSDHIAGILTGTEESNVIPLATRRA